MQKFIKQRIINPVKYSCHGLKAAWKTEQAFRIEIILGIIGIIFIIFYPNNILKKILLINSIFLVLIAELLNTAIEKTIDKISLDKHPISKIVKDIASAAVLIALINLMITWSILWLF